MPPPASRQQVLKTTHVCSMCRNARAEILQILEPAPSANLSSKRHQTNMELEPQSAPWLAVLLAVRSGKAMDVSQELPSALQQAQWPGTMLKAETANRSNGATKRVRVMGTATTTQDNDAPPATPSPTSTLAGHSPNTATARRQETQSKFG